MIHDTRKSVLFARNRPITHSCTFIVKRLAQPSGSTRWRREKAYSFAHVAEVVRGPLQTASDPVPFRFSSSLRPTRPASKEGERQRPHHAHRLRSRSLAFGWVNGPIEPTPWPEAQPRTMSWHRLFYCTHTMARKPTANRCCAREVRGLVGQRAGPTPRPPWPARGPLGRLREARQGLVEARMVAMIGIARHAHYDLTRVLTLTPSAGSRGQHTTQRGRLAGCSTLDTGREVWLTAGLGTPYSNRTDHGTPTPQLAETRLTAVSHD